MHKIRFLRKDGAEFGVTPWDMGLEKAKDHALSYLKVYSDAYSVEVIDTDTQKVVFSRKKGK